jgi:demethoxyubiquinone hydroxylase (CLK1/Coq7/Cat5 family)
MANFYKNQGFVLGTTLTTILTINASSVAIVKSISVTNEHNSNNLTEMYLHDASVSTNFEFFHIDMTADSTQQAAGQVLNLEAGDSIQAQAEVSGVVKGVISYLLIDRSQENG